MNAVLLDTHVVIWLFCKLTQKLPVLVKTLIESNDLYICPMVMLEIQYLYEINRINEPAKKIINDLQGSIGLKLDNLPLEIMIQKTIELTWTRDPFDRMIASNTIIRGYPLITKDEKLLHHLPLALWDNPKSLIQSPVSI